MVQAVSIQFSEVEKEYLFSLVRQVLSATVEQREVSFDDIKQAPVGILHKKLGVFVTYTKKGALHGCIGFVEPIHPLWQAVAIMSYKAACRDTRFAPISPDELSEIDFEITVLGPLSPCLDLDQIEIGRHGLSLEYADKGAIFLPQVPVEQGWNVQDTLEELCIKAGLPLGIWKETGAKVSWYEGVMLDPHDLEDV